MIDSFVHSMSALPELAVFGLDGFPLWGALVVLALLDSLSFGTLLIPIWLLLTPGRVRAGRLAIYLGTIVVFYFAVGLLLAVGASTFLTEITSALETPVVRWGQLIVGAFLLVFSFTLSPKKGAESGKLVRWRARAMGVTGESVDHAHPHFAEQLPTRAAATAPLGSGSPVSPVEPHLAPAAMVTAHGHESPVARARQRSAVGALMALALTAAAIELASMLPYLAGIGLIATSGTGWPASALLVAGYCIVMVVPALVLLAGRVFAAQAIEPALTRLGAWLAKNAAESTAWIVGIIGFLLARDAATQLGVFRMLGMFGS